MKSNVLQPGSSAHLKIYSLSLIIFIMPKDDSLLRFYLRNIFACSISNILYGILTPMARTSSRSRKEIPAPVQPSFFESLSPHTKQAIGSVSLIVFGVLFVLAYYGLAGRVGDYTHTGLSWLFGYGYALAPLLCFSYAILLLRPELDDHVSTP